ncbi:MAG: CoA transferase [Pseudonocardia sp.]|nr:CoA transferase [Pseudonocardia sp.]
MRVLDLTDERGLLAGRMLADLGADVVAVEPSGGSTARRRAPRDPGTGESFLWTAFAANKRGVVLDDPADVARLAAAADVVIMTWRPDDPGPSAEELVEANPRLIVAVISAFGRTGPKAGYAESDLVLWAAGGPLEPHRDGERPPLRISVPQAYRHAAADAAGGIMLARQALRRTGRGQVVDVAVQASLGVTTLARVLAHAVGDVTWARPTRPLPDRSGSGSGTPSLMKKWTVRDGLVELHLAVGPASGRFTNNLFGWIHAEGACPEHMAAWDWSTLPERIAAGELTNADLAEAREVVAAFLARFTKAEILRAAIEHRLLCVGINDMSDIASSGQLASRDYWADIGPHRLPGRFAHLTNGAVGVRRPAPRLGEHTADVLAEWAAREVTV